MTDHKVVFTAESIDKNIEVKVPTGTLLSDAAAKAGVEIGQPCGGQGRCGRCSIQVMEGDIRRRSTLRLSPESINLGYALACQSIVEADVHVHVPTQEKIERRLASDRQVAEISVPPDYEYLQDQTVRRIHLRLAPPTMDDQTDDFSRVTTALRTQYGHERIEVSLNLLQRIGTVLRESDWKVTGVVDLSEQLNGSPVGRTARLITLSAGLTDEFSPLWGIAVDIGTTTVTLWLVDLVSGRVKAQVSEYNGQIARGEDVISRIIYSSKNGGASELRTKVLETINGLLDIACKRMNIQPAQVVKCCISGNSVMMHLLLGIPAESIRISPFITAVNHLPHLTAKEVEIAIQPDATVICLAGVASYVGADITAGVLSSRLDEAENVSLFLDVGTNGEMVLGNRDWLVACACSAGPAFEGAGVLHGMRAATGAIEEVWINSTTLEPTYRVIGGGKPKGICGSGLIALLSEAFLTGIIDKAGNITLTKDHPRIRKGDSSEEYVVAWGSETETGQDIVLTRVDIDNLIRAKAAIYAGFTVLAENVGISLETVDKVLIGGSFGKYINVEKAIQIGLLPDLEWSRFEFLGNTSIRGAYAALLDWKEEERISRIAKRMTYIELSADNSFYEAFTSALFLPHTDINKFPNVALELTSKVPGTEAG